VKLSGISQVSVRWSYPFQVIRQTNIHAKPAIRMNEDSKNEFQLVLSGLQRLDSKIDSLQSSTNDDLKQLDSKSIDCDLK
jgi:hypothetical protein